MSDYFNQLKAKKIIAQFASTVNKRIIFNKILKERIQHKRDEIQQNRSLLSRYSHLNGTKNNSKEMNEWIEKSNTFIELKNVDLIEEIKSWNEKRLSLWEQLRSTTDIQEQYDKATVDGFILSNSMLQKDAVIKKMKIDWDKLKEFNIFKELNRNIYNEEPHKIYEEFADLNDYYQDVLLLMSWDYNKIRNKNRTNEEQIKVLKKTNKRTIRNSFDLMENGGELKVKNKELKKEEDYEEDGDDFVLEVHSSNVKEERDTKYDEMNKEITEKEVKTNIKAIKDNDQDIKGIDYFEQCMNNKNISSPDEDPWRTSFKLQITSSKELVIVGAPNFLESVNSDSENDIEFDDAVIVKQKLISQREIKDLIPKIDLKQIEFNKYKSKPEDKEIELSRRDLNGSVETALQLMKQKLKLAKRKKKNKKARISKYEKFFEKMKSKLKDIGVNCNYDNWSYSIVNHSTFPNWNLSPIAEEKVQ